MESKSQGEKTQRAFEAAAGRAQEGPYEFVLYIAGTTPQSARALETIASICDSRLQGRFRLNVIDVYQQPSRAKEDQIIAVPTLVKRRPFPVRRFVGDLSDRALVLRELDLPLDPEVRHEEEH